MGVHICGLAEYSDFAHLYGGSQPGRGFFVGKGVEMSSRYQLVLGEHRLGSQGNARVYTYRSTFNLQPGMIVTVPLPNGAQRTATVVQVGSDYTGECKMVTAIVSHVARPLCTQQDRVCDVGGFAVYQLTFDDQSTVLLPVPSLFNPAEFNARPLARIIEKLTVAVQELVAQFSTPAGVAAERKTALLSMALQYATANLPDVIDAFGADADFYEAAQPGSIIVDRQVLSGPTEDELIDLRQQIVGG